MNGLAGHLDGDGRATRYDSAKEGLAEDDAELGKASWKSERAGDWRQEVIKAWSTSCLGPVLDNTRLARQ